jgi:hypothetical protein
MLSQTQSTLLEFQKIVSCNNAILLNTSYLSIFDQGKVIIITLHLNHNETIIYLDMLLLRKMLFDLSLVSWND